MEKTVSVEYCTEQVRRMARRTALLHHYFAETLVDALGEERGQELVAEAIRRYGEHCGRSVRAQVEARGLALEPENFGKGRDLPEVGWEKAEVELAPGVRAEVVTFCPLADVFQEIGGVKFGRLYCHVDQAKQRAFNPAYEFIHAKNVLDGDAFCQFVVRKKG
jgi:hypothetical protein